MRNMIVYIVNYRGTVYGVFDSLTKAYSYVDKAFGQNDLDVNVLEREVE